MSLHRVQSTRRSFLKRAAATTSAISLSSAIPLRRASGGTTPEAYRLVGLEGAPIGSTLDTGGVRKLALRAIEVALAAGASYADVRLTRTIQQGYRIGGAAGYYESLVFGGIKGGTHDSAPGDFEQLAIGVRVLADGCWGFAASPFWTLDEGKVLATEAVRQAKANGKVATSRVELAPTRAVTGHWAPPSVLDPFQISPEEKVEHLRSLADYIRFRRVPVPKFKETKLSSFAEFEFTRLEWALATSDGTFCTQHRYRAAGDFSVAVSWNQQGAFGWQLISAKYPGLVGQGWELCNIDTAHRYIDTAVDEYFSARVDIPERQVDVGRYTVVCSAPVVAQLVSATIGAPTELDRALGYEANAGGTSYLNDPIEMAGSLKIGSPLLNITGNRSTPGHLATAKWDDEGVEPIDVSFIKDGVLNDFQTNRESAMWLSPYSKKIEREVRSNGCSASESALAFPLIHSPNLVMTPGSEELDVDDLVKNTEKGLLFIAGNLSMDFQGRNGQMRGMDVREIVNGKLGDKIKVSAIMLESSSWWKNLVAIGGKQSMKSAAMKSVKGEPTQSVDYTVSTVPIIVKDATVVDYVRRG